MTIRLRVALLAGLAAFFASSALLAAGFLEEAANPLAGDAASCPAVSAASPDIPIDSWVYPAMLRLYSLGYVDSLYLGMRPWTRASLGRMLLEASSRIEDAGRYEEPTLPEARRLYSALLREVPSTLCGGPWLAGGHLSPESAYSATRLLTGIPLRDSFHLGSSVVNDYGRPFAHGVNAYDGVSGYATLGPFLLYARGELDRAPGSAGYSTGLAQTLSALDGVPFLNPVTGLPYQQATLPLGPLPGTRQGRLVEAYVATDILHHIVSFGKQDGWLGPGLGGGMAYSNNAENIYAFRANRVEPLHIPGLSRFTGPFRYEFLIGPLQGHTNPNSPWVHLEKFSFRPTRDLEFGFERTIIWGGKGHEPVTLHTFLRSFFSVTAPEHDVKFSPQDPGARFSAFDFSYRLPGLRHWLTLYTDSDVHDDLSPISGPLHTGIRPGVFLSHVPGVPSLDFRVEAVSTDPPVSSNQGGHFLYWETVQTQGYTNKGSMFGDWIGREAKGGQGWLTYHLSGNEWLQLGFRRQKDSMSFLSGGTTLNEVNLQALKRFGPQVEVNATFAYQDWKAPLYLPGNHIVTSSTLQLTWFPQRRDDGKNRP